MRSFFVFGFSETNWNVTHNFIKSVTVFQEILKSTTGIRKRFEKKEENPVKWYRVKLLNLLIELYSLSRPKEKKNGIKQARIGIIVRSLLRIIIDISTDTAFSCD